MVNIYAWPLFNVRLNETESVDYGRFDELVLLFDLALLDYILEVSGQLGVAVLVKVVDQIVGSVLK
jgi:hypothetical protein